jgi:hypothetical protein
MLSEGRKRDAAANAILALSFAANAAQSPQALVRSGNVEAPGIQLMSNMMRKRKEANRNLDSGRVSHPARNRKMKTFKEFVEEAYLVEAKVQHFSSRAELEKHHGGIPSGYYAKNRGSKENPKWGLGRREERKQTQARREENIKISTGSLTKKQKSKVERKRTLAAKRGKELHHGTEVSTSAKKMKNMSPGDRLRFKSGEANQNRYHGNDPKNLVLANKGPVDTFKPETPGFHHSKYHAFERKNRAKLKDIEHILSPSRAFTTLVNKERRKNRKSKELQARMSAAADRQGIK